MKPARPVAVRPGKGGGRLLTVSIIALSVLVVGVVSLFYWKPGIFGVTGKQSSAQAEGLFERQARTWLAETGPAELDAAQHYRRGRDILLADAEHSCSKALTEFKKALIADSTFVLAVGGYVEAFASMQENRNEFAAVNQAFDLINAALERRGDLSVLHRARALLFHLIGSSADARAEATIAVNLKADDPENLAVLGLVAGSEDPAGAIEHMTRGITLNPNLNRYRVALGKLLMQSGHYGLALKQFETRMEKPGKREELLRLIAELFMSIGEYRLARRYLGDMLQANPQSSDAVILGALLDYQIDGKLKQAGSELQRQVERLRSAAKSAAADRAVSDPATLSLLRATCHLAHVRKLQGKPKEAESVLKAALSIDPYYSPADYLMALLKLEAGDAREAQHYLNKAQIREPPSPVLLTLEATIEAAMENFEEAVRKFADVRRKAPQLFYQRAAEAAVYLAEDAFEKAIGLLTGEMSYPPDFEKLHFMAGDFPVPDYYYSKAITAMRKILKAMPWFARAHSATGVLYYHSRAVGMAEKAFKQALLRDGGNFTALVYLGQIRLDLGAAEAAYKFLSKAIDSDRHNVVALSMLADTARTLRRFDEAATLYDDVSHREADYTPALSGMAELSLLTGKEEEALDLYVRAYKSDPDNIRVKSNLFKLGY